jgi:hypothetical protein
MDFGPSGRFEEVTVSSIKLHLYRQRFRFGPVQSVPELACVVPDELFERKRDVLAVLIGTGML